jgi:hypothetical protein
MLPLLLEGSIPSQPEKLKRKGTDRGAINCVWTDTLVVSLE